MKTTVLVCRVPHGDAPVEVREQWVGLTLRVAGVLDPEDTSEALGRKTEQCGVMIDFADALRALAPKSQEATRWLLSHAPDERCTLIFLADEVTVVDGPQMFARSAPIAIRQRLGLLEIGVGAHDHPANI